MKIVLTDALVFNDSELETTALGAARKYAELAVVSQLSGRSSNAFNSDDVVSAAHRH